MNYDRKLQKVQNFPDFNIFLYMHYSEVKNSSIFKNTKLL